MIQRVTVPARDVTPDTEKFYKLRGGIMGEDGKLRVVQHAFIPCSSHDDKTKACKTYDDRPQICRDFPSLPDQIEGTPCSHWFELSDDDGNVIERRGGLGSPHPTPPRFK
jgi:Fe-S-cluster containining protein